MKRKQVKELKEAFFIISEVKSTKLNFMAEKNWSYLDREEKKHEEKAIELRPKDTDKKIEKFFEAQKKVLKDHAKVVDGKELKNQQGGYVIDEDKAKEYEEAMTKLKEDHGDAVAMIEKYNKDFDAYMNEDVKIDFYYAGR